MFLTNIKSLDKRNGWAREINDLHVKNKILQNLWERVRNIASIVKDLKLLMKQIYEKECTEKFKMKKGLNIHFTSCLDKRFGKQLTLKQKQHFEFQ